MARQLILLCVTLWIATGCVPATVPTATPALTLPPVPTPTPLLPHPGELEGLVMMDGEQLIVGVNWLSKSRITYAVKGGDVNGMKRLLGETARVAGEIVDKGPWIKEIMVTAAEASTTAERLSMRIGYIKELGPSIYMQGSHVLVDREGKPICLLGTAEGRPDLNKYMAGKVVVIGPMSKTVEGDAQIMDVKQVEPAQ